MSTFRIPTGSPFCGVCGQTVPGHYPDCPVLTQEPQGGLADPQTGRPQQPGTPQGFFWAGEKPGAWGGSLGGTGLQPRPPYLDQLERIAAACEKLVTLWEEDHTRNK